MWQSGEGTDNTVANIGQEVESTAEYWERSKGQRTESRDAWQAGERDQRSSG